MPAFAANLSLLFTEQPLAGRFAAAAAAGFKYVEYQYPYELDKDEVASLLKDNGLTAVLHNLPPIARAACDPARTNDFRQGLAQAIDYAQAAGCKQLNCLAGNVPEGVDADTAYRTLIANLRYAAAELKRAGIRLLIEAINTRDVPGFYINNTKQAVAIIEAVDSDNLFLQYDVYHMQIMEGDLAHTMEANLARIAHIQVSDNPGRHEPGTGEINFPFLFQFLDRIGYQGYVGAEYRPAAGTLAGLGWIKPYLALQ
jgi:hydroxypyruvate isomerase